MESVNGYTSPVMLPSVQRMASINDRQRADGTPVFRVMFRMDGRQKSESFIARGTSPSAREEASRAAERFKALVERIGPHAALRTRDARDGADAEGAVPLLKDYFEHHLALGSALTDGTKDEYRRVAARTWLPVFGEFPLDAITRVDVARWVTRMATEPTIGGSKPGVILSSKSMRNAQGLLSSVLTSAVREDLITRNVAQGVAIPRGVKEEQVYLTAAEFAAFLPHVAPYYQNLVIFLVSTGLRCGEATCLRWSEVDLDSLDPQVRVIRAWKHGPKGMRIEGSTKTTKSERTVLLAEQAADLLRAMRREARARGVGAQDLVFTTPPAKETGPGEVIRHQNFYARVWQPAVRAYAGDELEAVKSPSGKVQYRVKKKGPGKHPRIHDLRHSFASSGITDNASLAALQRSLGHESITTTIDTYGHLDVTEGRQVARAATKYLALALPTIHDPAPALEQPVAVGS